MTKQSQMKQIARGVYPEQGNEILRSAQNDRKRRARNDSCGEEGLFSLKQLFPIDTKNSCSELFQDNRKCQVKADIIIKRREVTQEIKLNRALRNGGCWLSIGLAVGHENGISFAKN